MELERRAKPAIARSTRSRSFLAFYFSLVSGAIGSRAAFVGGAHNDLQVVGWGLFAAVPGFLFGLFIASGVVTTAAARLAKLRVQVADEMGLAHTG